MFVYGSVSVATKQNLINKQYSKPLKNLQWSIVCFLRMDQITIYQFKVCVFMFVYLFDGSLSYFVRVLPDALQEVSQLCHGRVPDLCPQLGDVFCHDGAEPVLTHSGKTRLFQLLQSPQSRVVPTVTYRNIRCTWKVPLRLFIHSVSWFLINLI